MKEVMVTVEYAGDNLSAYVDGAPVIATGKNLHEIEQNMQEAVKVYLESCKELGIEPSESLKGEITLKFHIDAATFITKAALSRITGINERQLWHYAAGVHKPRQRQLEKIQNGVFSLTKELQSFSLL